MSRRWPFGLPIEFEQSTIINNQTKVVYDHNWDDPQYPITVLENRSVLESDTIIGAAFHCYAGQVQAQSLVKQAVPSKRLFFTECCGGAWAPNFGSNLMRPLVSDTAMSRQS